MGLKYRTFINYVRSAAFQTAFITAKIDAANEMLHIMIKYIQLGFDFLELRLMIENEKDTSTMLAKNAPRKVLF